MGKKWEKKNGKNNLNTKVIPCHMSSIGKVERAEKFGQIQSSHPCAEAYLNPRLFLSHACISFVMCSIKNWKDCLRVISNLSSKLKLTSNLARKAVLSLRDEKCLFAGFKHRNEMVTVNC